MLMGVLQGENKGLKKDSKPYAKIKISVKGKHMAIIKASIILTMVYNSLCTFRMI